MQIALKLMLMYLSLFLLVLESNSHRISFRGWTEGGKMMAAGLGCSRARTVLTYLDKERVKLGDSRVDGSWLLGWPGVQQGKDCDPTTPRQPVLYSTENQFLNPEPGQVGDSCTPHFRDG